MKKSPAMIMLAVLAMACQHKTYTRIAPLPAGYDIDNLTDCTVPASFSAEDFNWRGSSLTLKVFSEDIYDAVEVHQMKPGDTLVFAGAPIVVKTVVEENGYLTVDGGIEEGGAYLKPYEGGTYRSLLLDDHPFYTEIGRTQVMLDDDFIIIDCGTEPTDPSDTIRTAQKPYIEALGTRSGFSELDTRVRIENGRITEVNRHWIP